MKKPLILMTTAAIGLGAAIATADSNDDMAMIMLPYADADAVARGAGIYADNCASCHGANLEGQPDWRQRNEFGRLPAPPQDETGHTWHHPAEQLFMTVKYGTAALVGNGYESDMVGFEGVLTDVEILEVLGFIKSTWPDEVIEQHNAMTTHSH